MTYRLIVLFSLGILTSAWTSNFAYAANDFSTALQSLQAVEPGTTSQAEIRGSWEVVAQGSAAQLTEILAAMRDTGPLAENWLRAAVDTIAERELQQSGKLPVKALEGFVLNTDQPPRARRTAYEWLTQVDTTASTRLLPKMLDDASLELRYDAVARLLSQIENASEETAKKTIYQQALAAARARDQMTLCIDQLEKLGAAPNLEKYFGYVTHWQVIGPFDNTAGVGISNVYPPEENLEFEKEQEGKSGAVAWQAYQPTADDLDDVGRVDLNSVVKEEKGVAAYAAATVVLASDQEVECRYETVNATELWVNGEQLASDDIYHSGGEFDQYVVPVKLKRGENTILLKICQNEQTETWARPWNFRLRITDGLGAGVKYDYASGE